jgi:PAS domain S-box-containing protein
MRADGTPVYGNQGVTDYTGLTLKDLQTEGFRARIYHPEDLERLREARCLAFTRPVPFDNEIRILGKDGNYRAFLFRYKPLLDEAGKIDRWYMAALDIEDRKRAEEALARQARVRGDVSAAFSKPIHLKEILRGCTEAIVRHLDAAFARIWILSKDESMLELQASAGMYTRLDGSYSRIPVGELKVGLIAREKKAHFTNDVMNDPRVHDKAWAKSSGMVAFAGYPLIVEDRLIGVVALFAHRRLSESILDTLASVADTIAQGIERRRAEEALQASERNLSAIINTIPTTAWTTRPDGYCDFLNQVWLDYAGMTTKQAQGWGWAEAIHPDDREKLVEVWQSCLASGTPVDTEARMRRFDSSYRWFMIRANPLRHESGNILKWYGTCIDIEDRKQAEAQLEQAFAQLTEAQRLSQTGSFTWDLHADEHTWSSEIYRIFGFELGIKVTMQMIQSAIFPEDVPAVEATIGRAAEGADFDLAFRLVTPSGALKHAHVVGHRVERIADRPVFVGAVQDVTESKKAEEALNRARSELAHMARVTTLSALTASIAHEVNQPIAAVTTSAGACLRWLNRDQPDVLRAREAAMRIEDDGRRAAEIISHLKSFYKKDVLPQREMVWVNELVGEMLMLLRSEADRHSVVMRTELEADLPAVNADRVQLQQVLMNLMLNGMEAMSEGGGELRMSTRRETGEVVVSVRDTGVGIPDDKMEEIFNAFITTKVEGTGMGLAISSTIIESHGGRLWATSNRERGSTFHFALPTEQEAQK